jgi:hypothetical protein
MAVVASLAAMAVAAGCGGSSGNPNAIHHGTKVSGQPDWDMFADGGVNDDITTDRTWCAWSKDGSHVILGITFHNSSTVADLDVSYDTTYTVVDGGTHGDSSENDETTRVAAGKSVRFVDNAGSPSGIVKFAPIGSCRPYISSVDSPS